MARMTIAPGVPGVAASTREVGKAGQPSKVPTPAAPGHREGKTLWCRCKAWLCTSMCTKQKPDV